MAGVVGPQYHPIVLLTVSNRTLLFYKPFLKSLSILCTRLNRFQLWGIILFQAIAFATYFSSKNYETSVPPGTSKVDLAIQEAHFHNIKRYANY